MRKLIMGIMMLCIVNAQNSTTEQNTSTSIEQRCQGLSSLFLEVQNKSPRIYYKKMTEQLTSCITTTTQPSQSQIKSFAKALCRTIVTIDYSKWKSYDLAESVIDVMECRQEPHDIDDRIYDIKRLLEASKADAKKIQKTLRSLTEIRNSAWGRNIVADFDEDYDGKLSKKEKKALIETLYERKRESAAVIAMVDKNGNGKLNSSELRQLYKETRTAFNQQRKSLVRRYDSDNNGKLNKSEIKKLNSFIEEQKKKKQQKPPREKPQKDGEKNPPPPKKKFKKKK
ncbi:EF-hand domain-containing protein [Candidatus Uabimicrobium amorphum]|uniref:EF-hand domain-containing protein n=1 Tax=Uabimicrobium amorphum TaxID=2596890 RepID=A0A5S9F288_UABAM|nr:EF-hand domain-containing protein [Candidatus Uabimicrobium amorphum]BBM83405.1 hypothetical protein UABAM_01757 [Candidatus Uabimicrobium amorphum]